MTVVLKIKIATVFEPGSVLGLLMHYIVPSQYPCKMTIIIFNLPKGSSGSER